MINDLLLAFWFFMPAGFANVAAFFSGKIPYLDTLSFPADFYVEIRGKRILGSHKTIRGFAAGILGGILFVYLQIYLFTTIPFLHSAISLDYTQINPIILGSLLGAGALIGDAVKSFFKRQIDIKPGKSWFPFDQIDYIVGGVLLSWFYIQLTAWEYVFIFAVWFLIHPFTTFMGYLLKLEKQPL